MSSDSQCSVTLPHGAMGWSAVCFVVFPDQTHLLLGLKARLSTVHSALRDVNVNV